MSRIRKTIEGLSPLIVSIFLLIVTLLCPMMITSTGWGSDSEEHYWVNLAIVAITWIYLPISGDHNPISFGVHGYGLFVLNPSALLNTLPITFLSILYAAQVVRFRMDEASRKPTLLLGLCSILPATIWGLMGYMAVVQSGLHVYVGPIPIQLIVGLLFMKYSANWQIDMTFDGEDAKNWWEKEASN